MMLMKEIQERLSENGYLSTPQINYAVSACVNMGTPLLVEGFPGVGKTALAKATAAALGLPLLRVQFYEGLTADKILYDYNYQRQLLTIESIKSALANELDGMTANEAVQHVRGIDFFGEDFLIKRPILEAISGTQRYVLLLDEIDKCSEEIEYTLLEVLDEFSMSIPQYGTVRCPEEMRPVVFLTSNNYRELSDALKRRCSYLYIEKKTKEEIKAILLKQAKASPALVEGVASCLVQIQDLNLKQTPSVAEGIEWANFLESIGTDNIEYSICLLAKNREDQQRILASGIAKRSF